jgi:hypothetical protein
MSSQPSIADALRDLWSQISVLAVSGLAGAAFRAILAPERKWKRRLIQGAGGAISAVFLGGMLGHMLDRSADRRRLLRIFRRRLHHGCRRRGRRQGAAGPHPRSRQMSWLLTVHDLSSALVAALCWWLSHARAVRRGRSGTLAALGYAVLASAVAVSAIGRSLPAGYAVLDWSLVAGKLALASVLALVAMSGETAEKL